MTSSILANNRIIAPFSMAGDKLVQTERNWVGRPEYSREELGFAVMIELQEGNVFVIEAPCGGGFLVCKD